MSGLLDAAKVALTVALVVLGVQWIRAMEPFPWRRPVKNVPVANPARRPQPHAPGIFAAEPEARIEAFRELERAAQQDAARRQEFVDQVLAQLHYRFWSRTAQWQPTLWSLVLPHLRPGEREFWPDIDLSLVSGVLLDVDLSGCEVRDLAFERVRLVGTARFVRTVFTGDVTFEHSCFAGHARFREAEFRGAAGFEHVTFTGTASFPGATVAGPADFHAARFSGLTDFTGARFAGPFGAIGAGFAGRTWFRDTHFAARTRFARARFTGHADFAGASFVDAPGLGRALARTDWYAIRTWPAGWEVDGEGVELPRRPGRWAELTR